MSSDDGILDLTSEADLNEMLVKFRRAASAENRELLKAIAEAYKLKKEIEDISFDDIYFFQYTINNPLFAKMSMH